METLRKNPFSVIFSFLDIGPIKGRQNLISGPAGIGKTNMLVHLGIFRILNGHHILHVSKAPPDRVSLYYEAVLLETLKELPPKELQNYKDLILHKRTILSFVDQRPEGEDLLNTLENLSLIYYEPCCVLLDGFQEGLFGERGYLSLLKDRPFEIWATWNGTMDALESYEGNGYLLQLGQVSDGIQVKAYDLTKGKEISFIQSFVLSTSSLLWQG